jgi:S-adenosylmethionine decarboxylase proenzyme|tara:strand:+ start:3123 stop:3506 length:384 start_codon:yes stop_codon:yes gene_type:complete
MNESTALGVHILLDYMEFLPTVEKDGAWMLDILRQSVRDAGVREVHSHVEEFDGEVSPLGFAAVVLIDESHVSAHCYSERGLLAIDVFTCGDHDPEVVADSIHASLCGTVPGLNLLRRERIERFMQG